MSSPPNDRRPSSPIVFLVDCHDCRSPVALAVDLRTKSGFAAGYRRAMIDSCLEGIAEYERLAQDLSLAPIQVAVVCTGSAPHLRTASGAPALGDAPDLTQARWQQSLDMACQSLNDGDRLIVVVRHQQGLADTDLQLDDVADPISIIESVQRALLATGRHRSVKLTVIRVVSGADTTPSSSMLTALVPYGLADAFPVAVECFLVPLPDIFVAFWELAQRHLDLRSINVSGIPMKKSRKQANVGRKFSVAFLYPNTDHSELDRIQDQNELAQGLVRLGSSSPWLSRRSKDVFWSHAPDGFDLGRVLFSSIHLVTPSNLSSPLTAPLMKAALAPNGLLFFSDKESDPPNLIMALHQNRLYIHEIGSIIDLSPDPDPIVIPAKTQAFIQQLDWVSQMMMLRPSSASADEQRQPTGCDDHLLERQLGSLLNAKLVSLADQWTNCRLHTIYSSCMRAMLSPLLSSVEIRDLSVAIEALQSASIAADVAVLPPSVGQADIPLIYDAMWRSLAVAAAVIRRWSSEHNQAANLVNAASPSTHIRLKSHTEKQTLMDAFWQSECQRMSSAGIR